MSTQQHDPLDRITELGYRVVPMEDFDDQVYIADDIAAVLIDCELPALTALRIFRELLGLPCLCHGAHDREAC